MESIMDRIARVDRLNMKEDMDAWPELARDAWDRMAPTFKRDFDSIALVGVGGSGIVGELISDIASESGTNLHFDVVRDFHLPKYVDEKTLIVGISCSGNTKETLFTLAEAAKKGFSGFTFGSGGMLEQFSKRYPGFRFTKTTMLKSPRSSLPGFFYPILKFFLQNNVIKMRGSEAANSLGALARVRSDSKDPEQKRNEAFGLASRLVGDGKGVVPLVYASGRTKAVGMRYRQSLNETAKLHAYNGEVPELCHNEIVPWNPPGKVVGNDRSYVPIMLRLADDPLEVQINFDILKNTIIGQNRVIEAPYIGRDYLSRVLSMLYYLDYSTYYTGVLRGVDPLSIPSMNKFKEQLGKRLRR